MSVTEIAETRQYLTFKLGDEVFGIDVAKVREVLDFTSITKVPRTPDFMSGVINLRGNVVPVVDLRLCFEMSRTQKTVNTCIVVVEVLLEGESTIIGALADSVEEESTWSRIKSNRRPKSASRSEPILSRAWESAMSISS